jgi:hypothetical protein
VGVDDDGRRLAATVEEADRTVRGELESSVAAIGGMRPMVIAQWLGPGLVRCSPDTG